MAFLDFDNSELESEFAAHFGYRCRVPTFLLSVVFCLIWSTRFCCAFGGTNIQYIWPICGCFVGMAILHFLNTVAIYRKPSVCCGEKRKAMIGVLDSLCCMVMVLVCSNRADVARSSTPARLIISTPFMIFSIHGWAVPFGGFRLSADIFLHLLNLQVYLFTKLQIQGVHSWPIISTALLAFVTCTLMPVMLNVVFEANIRANYLARRNLSSQHLGTFWHWLRQRGIAHNAQA